MIGWQDCPECKRNTYVVIRNTSKGGMVACCEECRVEWFLPNYRLVDHPRTQAELNQRLAEHQRIINQTYNPNEDYR